MAVQRRDQALDPQAVAVDHGVGPGRDVAVAAELGQEGPLGPQGPVAGLVVDGGQQGPGRLVVGPALDGQGPLARLGQDDRGVQDLGRLRRATQAVEGGHGHDDGTVVGGGAEAGVHVPPEADEGQVRAVGRQLGPAPGRAGGDPRAGREVGQRPTHQRVPGVGPFGHGGDDQAVGGGRRQVLGRVDGQVGPPVEDGGLDLLDEDALAPDLGQRAAPVAVAGGGDDDGLVLEGRVDGREQRGDVVGLPTGQRATAGRGPEPHG